MKSNPSARTFLILLAMLLFGALPATALAADTYAAIAFSQSTGVAKAAWNHRSKDAALAQAVAACGRGAKPATYWVKNAWIAIAVGNGNGYGWGWGTTRAIAERQALNACAKHTSGGRVRRSVASYYK